MESSFLERIVEETSHTNKLKPFKKKATCFSSTRHVAQGFVSNLDLTTLHGRAYFS